MLIKSARNIQKVQAKKWNQVSTKDLIHNNVILIQKDSINNLARIME
jgi:hypothetical protein